MPHRQYGPYTLETSHEDKVLFPADGIRKGELIDHYERVATLLVPHAEEHPLSLERYPDNIDNPGFYQKQPPDSRPDWSETVELDKEEGGQIQQLVVNNMASLAWLAQLGCITPHLWLARADQPRKPDRLVFDLDPPDEDSFKDVISVAQRFHDVFDALDLPLYVMSSGSRGLHLWLPLRPQRDVDELRGFSRAVCEAFADADSEHLTTEQRKVERGQRIFLDWLRNGYAQTTAAPWSVRARAGAPVALPLEWGELNDSLRPDAVTLRTLPKRLEHSGDPWARMRTRAVKLAEPDSIVADLREQLGLS